MDSTAEGVRQSWSPGGEEHWLHKDGGVRLFLWRKRRADLPSAGVILWIHGSSMASQPTFDLEVPGRPDSSIMDWFAARGYDCWSLDNEGYGRSDKHRPVNADLANGVADMEAAVRYIQGVTGRQRLHIYGISSGALKAAMYAAAHSGNVGRLALEAMVWTGADSPTLIERRKKLPQWLGSLRRPMGREDIRRIFTRDRDGLADERTLERFTDAVLSLDDSMPNGTYVDMCSKLPCVDPAAIHVPTLLLRGEYDGIASYADVAAFFEKIPAMDKQFSMLSGIGHGGLQSHNYRVVYHLLHGFFSQPSALKVA
jgi:alpha-beta hydrolase superfamily lysophospholipase